MMISKVWQEDVSRVRKTGSKAVVKLISVTTILPILAMVIRHPLMFFLLVAGAWADSAVALGRIGQFPLAEEQDEPYTIHPEADLAIDADSDFTWETVHNTASAIAEGQLDNTKNPNKSVEPTPPADDQAKESEADERQGEGEKGGAEPVLPTDAPQESEKKLDEKTAGDKPFQLNNFKVQKGSFVVVLGPVGCGIKAL
ncbi:hypothetical protein FOMPIDRAFT_1045494 [Fomitopsis schrenkii]|uniref:ABC transmembrane type-1 domain-containing protein n=1 Tax=Fomitopsis schrenkii TaxID=2126942 RepID=S8EP72_FOMSC|nr:hypothetical protein FOMPIDRAFT_1045494 [Fomitopsis schrenkii]